MMIEPERFDLNAAYYRRLVSPGREHYGLTIEQQTELVVAWCRYESVGSVLKPDPVAIEKQLREVTLYTTRTALLVHRGSMLP